MTESNPKRTVTYAGLMAYRKQEYSKHYTPCVKPIDAMEESLQEYLNTPYAGDDVFVVLHREGQKPHTRLWEWNANEFKHGPSCVAWLRKKLQDSFSFSEEQIADHIDKVVHIALKQTSLSGDDIRKYAYDEHTGTETST